MHIGDRVTVSEGKYVNEPGTLRSIDDNMAVVMLDRGFEVRVWPDTPKAVPEVPCQVHNVGDKVSFQNGRRIFTGTVEKVGTKNLTIRYTKGAGTHLFTIAVPADKVTAVSA